MIPLWQACLFTALFMGFQDAFGASLVIAEGRNLWLWPGLLDAAGDWVNRAGQALTAGAYVRYGLWSYETQALLAVTMLTSFTVTNTVTPLATAMLPKERKLRPRRRRHGLAYLVARLELIEEHVGLEAPIVDPRRAALPFLPPDA